MPIGAVDGVIGLDGCLSELDINEEMVIEKLQKMRQYKGGGVDELVPRLLILIKEEISHPLTVLFRKSLAEGVVPEDWKRANVSPIYKKGKKYCREL